MWKRSLKSPIPRPDPLPASNMENRFHIHYTLEEARALLPQIREWLGEIEQLRKQLKRLDERLGQMISDGADAGGESVHKQIKLLADLKDALQQFEQREIQIKDIDRGLIDFPAFIGGREVFLCWERDEDDIEFWHDLDTGYAGRERL